MRERLPWLSRRLTLRSQRDQALCVERGQILHPSIQRKVPTPLQALPWVLGWHMDDGNPAKPPEAYRQLEGSDCWAEELELELQVGTMNGVGRESSRRLQSSGRGGQEDRQWQKCWEKQGQRLPFPLLPSLLQRNIWLASPKSQTLQWAEYQRGWGPLLAPPPLPRLVLAKVRPVTQYTLSKGPVRLPHPGRPLCPRLPPSSGLAPRARL